MSSDPPSPAPRPGPVAIEARNLHKSFRLPIERHDTLKERALRPRTWFSAESRELTAIQGISFDVGRGEFFGIVGRNGSGKSTLLKLLASIYKLDRGSIRVAGRLAPFIELGIGFDLELTARDNVVLNGVMMGLSPAEARSRFDAVIDYAELWDYTELKLKNYSSGMQVRLAFALMLQADADVLLVDEVLAVGDAAFQRKCTDSLHEIRDRGTTVVLVTHDTDAVNSHCERAMLIENGRIELIGDPRKVTDRYVEVAFSPSVEAAPERDAEAKVTAVWITDAKGATVDSVPQGEQVTLNATVRAARDLPYLELFLELINNPEGVRIASFTVGRGAICPISAGEEATVRIRFRNPLHAGNYRLNYALGIRDPELRVLDRAPGPTRLEVLGSNPADDLVDLEHEISVDREAEGARR